jgi:hypothetical protein
MLRRIAGTKARHHRQRQALKKRRPRYTRRPRRQPATLLDFNPFGWSVLQNRSRASWERTHLECSPINWVPISNPPPGRNAITVRKWPGHNWHSTLRASRRPDRPALGKRPRSINRAYGQRLLKHRYRESSLHSPPRTLSSKQRSKPSSSIPFEFSVTRSCPIAPEVSPSNLA